MSYLLLTFGFKLLAKKTSLQQPLEACYMVPSRGLEPRTN